MQKQKMRLLEPIEINGMRLKNRIGMAPLLNMPRAPDWGVDESTVRWFEHRARGGTGLIVTGSVIPATLMAPDAGERFQKLADALHAYDTKLGVQITGMGGAFLGLAPSAGPFPDEEEPRDSQFDMINVSFPPLQPLTADQIKQEIELIALAASALKQAGVDCVQLHCAHGGATLFSSFISPFYNRRQDEYGGSWENRLRFPVQTIQKIREAVGADYPILVRINADDLLGERGTTLKDAVEAIVPRLEKAGVDCFDVSQGSITHSPEGIEIPLYYPRGCYINNAEAVKRVTGLPVIGVGRIVDLDMAERFLQEDKADIIYLGRQITCDPDTPNKYFQGRGDEIRKCIGCLEGCGTPCPINYDIEPSALPLLPAENPARVLVIGGGVAGMEAARVCVLRGHSVTLLEKDPALGGTVAALALDPLSVEFGNIVDYLGVQMRKLGVDVRVCKEAGLDDIKEINPDAVILATGASLRMPGMVSGMPSVMDHVQALRDQTAVGRRVVVWGLLYGAEFAISLAEQGKEVVLVGESGEKTMAAHASRARRWWIRRKIGDFNPVRAAAEAQRLYNPRVLLHTRVRQVTSGEVVVTDGQGKQSRLPYDTLIISRGRTRNDSLLKALQGKVPRLFAIGDCASPGNIKQAIFGANEVARKI